MQAPGEGGDASCGQIAARRRHHHRPSHSPILPPLRVWVVFKVEVGVFFFSGRGVDDTIIDQGQDP